MIPAPPNFRRLNTRTRCAASAALSLFLIVSMSSTISRAQNTDAAEQPAACFAADQALAASQWETARSQYETCLSAGSKHFGSKHFEVLSNLAVALTHLGRTEEAIQAYRKALEISSGNPEVRLNLALALIKTENYQASVEQLIQLQNQDPDNIRVQELLALCYYHLERYSLSARAAERVNRSHPDDPANALILGSSYSRMGLYEKAVPLIAFALKSAGSVEAHYIMGETFLGLRLYKSALAELSQVAAEDPEFPGLHSASGVARVGLGDSGGAAAEFARALNADPTDFEANYYLGRLKRLDGARAEAQKYLTKALTSRPASSEVLFEFAAMAMTDRDYSKAEPLLDKVVRQQPDHSEAHFLLSQLYNKTGRREAGRKEQELFEKLRKEQLQRSQSLQGQADSADSNASSSPPQP
jgi:tetratricopeptide (TPR) repeat protein